MVVVLLHFLPRQMIVVLSRQCLWWWCCYAMLMVVVLPAFFLPWHQKVNVTKRKRPDLTEPRPGSPSSSRSPSSFTSKG